MPEPINPTKIINHINQGGDSNFTGGDYLTPYSAGIRGMTEKDALINYDSKFNFISAPVRKLIFDFSTAEFIEERIGIKFDLSRIQKKEIANLIREVLLGNVFIGDFDKSIQTKLNVDDRRAKDIASMIVGELFPSVIESIKITQKLKFAEKIQALAKDKREKSAQQPMTQPLGKPSMPPPLKQPTSSQPGQVRPPLEMPPRRTQPPPNQQATRPPQPSFQQTPNRPPANLPQRFKIPDLGSSFDSGQSKSEDAKKSLEQELEKVANVIDLRNEPNN